MTIPIRLKYDGCKTVIHQPEVEQAELDPETMFPLQKAVIQGFQYRDMLESARWQLFPVFVTPVRMLVVAFPLMALHWSQRRWDGRQHSLLGRALRFWASSFALLPIVNGAILSAEYDSNGKTY